MSVPFRPRSGLIIVFATVFGPLGKSIFKLALDTGATDTMLRPARLEALGYDLTLAPLVSVTTGSGVAQMPDIIVTRLEALGQTRADFPLLAYTLPPTSTVDGVLGLDFLRGHLLTVNFRIGQLSLA